MKTLGFSLLVALISISGEAATCTGNRTGNVFARIDSGILYVTACDSSLKPLTEKTRQLSGIPTTGAWSFAVSDGASTFLAGEARNGWLSYLVLAKLDANLQVNPAFGVSGFLKKYVGDNPCRTAVTSLSFLSSTVIEAAGNSTYRGCDLSIVGDLIPFRVEVSTTEATPKKKIVWPAVGAYAVYKGIDKMKRNFREKLLIVKGPIRGEFEFEYTLRTENGGPSKNALYSYTESSRLVPTLRILEVCEEGWGKRRSITVQAGIFDTCFRTVPSPYLEEYSGVVPFALIYRIRDGVTRELESFSWGPQR